jgi:pimeloyl-ACP methyl ester carboxylesterase
MSIRIHDLHHACLRVLDLDEATARWSVQFGLEVVAKERWATIEAVLEYATTDPRHAAVQRLHERAMRERPGVFKGDLHFYKIDGDIRERIGAIDTAQCPLYLLSGEYDYSCTPAETLEVARRVPGARATIMSGLGHFPMSEDPQRFLDYLRPVLETIG